jgi:hypothetical protein
MRKPSKKTCFGIIIFVCFSLLIVCSIWAVITVKSIYATPTLSPRREWVNKWLYDPTCQPPCWEGITPGVTSIDDVPKLLANVPGIWVTTPPTHYSFGSSESIEMQWRLAENAADSGLAEASDEQSRLVSYMILTTGSSQSFFLEDVILSYGFPSDAQIAECRPSIGIGTDYCVVYVIYRQSGMALELYLPGKHKDNWKVGVLPNASVEKIYFFPQEADTLEMIINTQYAVSPPVKWKGYAEYP